MWVDECFAEICIGDKVWYKTPQQQTHTAKAIFRGPAGWVCDRGNGQPVVINEDHNYLGHTKGRSRKKDHIGSFLNG